jgi:hypothetical protein
MTRRECLNPGVTATFPSLSLTALQANLRRTAKQLLKQSLPGKLRRITDQQIQGEINLEIKPKRDHQEAERCSKTVRQCRQASTVKWY